MLEILREMRSKRKDTGYIFKRTFLSLCIGPPTFVIVERTKNDRLSREINRFDVSSQRGVKGRRYAAARNFRR